MNRKFCSLILHVDNFSIQFFGRERVKEQSTLNWMEPGNTYCVDDERDGFDGNCRLERVRRGLGSRLSMDFTKLSFISLII
jgi:hypothetical protein